jgi:RHS repeat-associated protein
MIPTLAYPTSAYAPFGEQYAISGPPDASFTGQNPDTVSTLYDFTFREYSPSQGRWISPDPAGLSAVDPTNPQSWNRYAYVLNNPLIAIDPLGLDCIYLNDDNSVSEVISGNCFSPTDNGYYVNESGVDPNSISFSADGSEMYYSWSNPQNPDDAGTGVLGTGPSAVQTTDSSLSWALNFATSFFGGFTIYTGPGSCLGVAVNSAQPLIGAARKASTYAKDYVAPIVTSLPGNGASLSSGMYAMANYAAQMKAPAGDVALFTAGAAAMNTAATNLSVLGQSAVSAAKNPYVLFGAIDTALAYGVGKEAVAAYKGKCR